ncbi:hypothetical protein EDB87DRAFT_1402000 [Lactarius vividus]|nr:hypothetical protein EDB87DRAFT_1402000 [Lactarius vividus]
MSRPEDPPTPSDPSSSQHRPRASLSTSASGIADSTISFTTYATGITDGSLCLSQFPPPPVEIPVSPITDRFLHSPARSTFTITTPQLSAPSTEWGLPSPARSTFSIASRRTVGPALPSPARSTFTVAAPAPATLRAPTASVPQPSGLSHQVIDDSLTPDHNTDRPPHPNPRTRSRSPTPPVRAGKLSPYDWHEGSSIISVDPTEERMLSTSFITGLLSSATSVNASRDASDPQSSRLSFQVDTGSLVSEMFYPPPSRYHEPGVGLSRFPPSSYPFTPSSEGPHSHFNGENDTIASYDGYADIAQPGSALTRKVSVVGMAQATLRHVPSATSVPESVREQSQATYSSTSPLNPHSPSAFSTSMDGARHTDLQQADVQPLIGALRPLTPGTPELRASMKLSAKRQRRVSALSTKTVKSHVSSLISSAGQRTARAARTMVEWMRIKPLPPVPTIPDISLYQEQEHRRMEGSVPLPQLAERADRLNAMLDSGHLPDDGLGSPGSEKAAPSRAYASGLGMTSGGRRRQSMTFPSGREVENSYGPAKAKSRLFKRPISRNKIKLFVGIFVAFLLVLIGIIVGVTVGHKRTHTQRCPANRTGNACDLDSTCVCVSTQCNVLAQSLVNLIPFVNDQFHANLTPAVVANAMSSSRASALSSDCAAQARVIDVSPALDSQTVPNRTAWAQSTLLWSFVLSQNTSSVGRLRDFITEADWKSLPGDGAVTGQSSKFSTTQLGYVFDFATQTISEPAVSFIPDGQPSSSQLAEMSNIARTTLDRMYTFASASSTIRSTAMGNYWQYILQQDPNNYLKFVSLLISSPILLPFDASGNAGNTPISSLLTNSTSAPFPPPLSCYPSLATSQLALISNLETSVFGLSTPTAQTSFNNSCYGDRPIYGVLDVLHLRLPFRDSQTGTAKQAAILSRDATPRVVVYNGQALSGLPNSNVSSIPTADPRRFGTLNHINHVLLDFFEAIPDLNVAVQFVNFVLSSTVTPPSSDTLLGQSLNAIPTLEVAIFGSVTPPDVEGVVSSFATPSGGLFFGSDNALAVRDWALVGTETSVIWTEFANSPEIVNDESFADTAFNKVWDPASLFFHFSTNATVNVGNITAAFTAVNKFTST